MKVKYLFTVTLKFLQIWTCSLNIISVIIKVVLNSAAVTLEITLNPSNLSNFASILELRAYGTGFG